LIRCIWASCLALIVGDVFVAARSTRLDERFRERQRA
jgi:hypothetical protein